MSERPCRPAKPPQPVHQRSPEEVARLEQALRANLKRRRAQKAARSEPKGGGGRDEGGGPED